MLCITTCKQPIRHHVWHLPRTSSSRTTQNQFFAQWRETAIGLYSGLRFTELGIFVALFTNHNIKSYEGVQIHNHAIFFLVVDCVSGKFHDLAVLIQVLNAASSLSGQIQWLSKPDDLDRNQSTSQFCECSALTQLRVRVKG
jgi:hypothetical protein